MGKKKKEETRKEKYLAAEENLSKRVKVKKTGKTEKEVKPEKAAKPVKKVKPEKTAKSEKKAAKGGKSGKKGNKKEAVKVKDFRNTAAEKRVKEKPTKDILRLEEIKKETAATGTETGLSQNSALSAQEAAAIFRALGDESRMQILRLLEEKELRITDLQKKMKLVQSTLSHHMKVLTECGIVISRREGISTYYMICEETFARVAAYLTSADYFHSKEMRREVR